MTDTRISRKPQAVSPSAAPARASRPAQTAPDTSERK